jgi:hypothetical protein
MSVSRFGDRRVNACIRLTGLLSRFEKDHAQDILVALREAVGAKPPTAGSAAGKRARETDNNAMDRKAKKSKLFDV